MPLRLMPRLATPWLRQPTPPRMPRQPLRRMLLQPPQRMLLQPMGTPLEPPATPPLAECFEVEGHKIRVVGTQCEGFIITNIGCCLLLLAFSFDKLCRCR